MNLAQIRALPADQQAQLLTLIEQLEEAEARDKAKDHFIPYMQYMWPPFIMGRHLQIMGEAFDRVISGDCKRLIINMGPRHTKSETTSIHLPSKWFGHYPSSKIIQTSHTAELASGFGRKVRNLVNSDRYHEVFPDTILTPDSKAAGRWSTSGGGEYFAIGIGGKIAGKGADLLIIDDPHSEQDYIIAQTGNTDVFDKAFEWYQTGPRQRLQPGGAIVICMTRWHSRDITGRLIKRMTTQSKEQWEIIEFPALMPETDNPLFPEFWSYEELIATRDELSPQQWAAQYLQNPTSEGAAIVKREWWRIWPHHEPPEVEYIIQSWDTAYLAKESSDYNACNTWGIFYREDPDTGQQKANIILLDAFRERMEFPALKKKALELYKERTPDVLIVEAKASGWPLIQELRNTGIPVSEYTPVRGTARNPNSKIVRVHAIAPLFEEGVVWIPDTRWAEDVMEEWAAFPQGDNDDYVDAGVIALMRYRQGGFIPLDSDEDEEPFHQKRAEYY